MNYTPLPNCLFCNSDNIHPYLDLGEQPPANSYCDTPNEQIEEFPLVVNLCNNCGHSQLSISVKPEILFSNYLYVSGTTKTLENHFKEFAKDSTDRYGTGKVLEIGCNDGSCLKQFKALGWEVLGVDPAINLLEFSGENSIPVVPVFWQRYVSQLPQFKRYNLIYGTNVFAHNVSPFDFLRECMNVLEDEGTIIIEAPYAYNMFKIIDIGQIYHEHINYLSCNPIKELCDILKLGVVDIVQTDVHGGSIRFYFQPDKPHCQKLYDLIEQEIELGMREIKFYNRFSETIDRNINELRLFMLALQKDCKIIAYGAAAKASTIINASEKMPLDYIVDDNPLKVGKYMPSTDIKILPTSTISEEQSNLCIWITAHNFKKEIIERIKEKRPDKKDVAISYTPIIKFEKIQL